MDSLKTKIKIDTKLLCCPVCHIEFNANNFRCLPKILPHCGHTICSSCLGEILGKASFQAKCPLDSQRLLADSVSSKVFEAVFKDNLIVMSILNQRVSKNDSLKYKQCDQHKRPKKSLCLTDKALICCYCNDTDHLGHKVMKIKNIECLSRDRRKQIEKLIEISKQSMQIAIEKLDQKKAKLENVVYEFFCYKLKIFEEKKIKELVVEEVENAFNKEIITIKEEALVIEKAFYDEIDRLLKPVDNHDFIETFEKPKIIQTYSYNLERTKNLNKQIIRNISEKLDNFSQGTSKKYPCFWEPKNVEEVIECKNEETGIEINKNDLEYLLADKQWKECLQNVPDADKLINNLVDLGFAKPSKIQSKTIPFAMTGRNVGILAQSYHDSGKTLGFAIPAILRVDPAKPLHLNGNQTLYYPQVIILTPTVELSTQIVKVVQMIAKPFQNIKVSSGKVAAHIVVRTPKSLLKLMSDKNVDLSNVALCVVDEADELLQGESGQSLLGLIKKIPKDVASLYFFSTTYTEESISYINSFFKLLKITLVMRYMLKAEELRQRRIHQFSKRLDPKNKAGYIDHLLDNLETDMQIIIFANKESFAETMFRALQSRKHSVNLLTGQRPCERNDILNDFKKKKFKTLVTTTRFVDQRTIGLVINVDIPRHYSEKPNKPDLETYFHRIRTTARLGDVGLALDLYTTDEERNMLNEIETHYQIQIKDLSNFDDKAGFEMLNESLKKVGEVNDVKRKELDEHIQPIGKPKGK